MAPQVGTLLASGSRVSVRYTREYTRGATPAGVGTPVTNVATEAVPTYSPYDTTGYSEVTRGTGSFIDDGFYPGQTARLSGFIPPTINGDYKIAAVPAGDTIILVDPNAVIGTDSAVTANTVQIVLKKLRTTGRNINLEKNVLESEEVDEDGQVTDVRHGFNRVVGSPGFQLSLYDYDDFIEFFLTGTWVTPAPGSLTFTLGPDPVAFTGSNLITNGIRPGDIIRTADGKDVRILTITAEGTGTAANPVGDPIASVDNGAATFPGSRMDLTPGLLTFLMERAFTDVDQYQVFNGCTVNTMQMTVSPEAIINGTFDVLGMSAAALSGTQANGVGVTPVEASGSTPFAAFDGSIFEGGTLIGVVTSMDFSLERNRSLNPVVGSKFSPDVFEGTARGTGTVSAYFQDATLFNRFANEEESSVWNKFQDPADSTNFMNIVFPRVKYTGANIDPPQEGPIVMEMPFQPLKATGLAAPGGLTVNTMMTIQRSNS